MQVIKGQKRKGLFNELIEPNLPIGLCEMIYVEPFAGSFSVSTFLKEQPKKMIYNDIIDYEFDIKADEILNHDYSFVIDKYDSENTFFYIDPPYYGKEDWYGNKKNDLSFHQKLFSSISNIKGKFIISYEDNNLIRNIWNNFEIKKYSGNHFAFRNEILIIKK